MKSILIGFLLVLIISNQGFPQSGWVYQNNPSTLHLRSIYFLNENTGFIGGSNGEFLKTINGGLNWTMLPKFCFDESQKIQFLNELTGWVLTYDTIYKSSNGGNGFFKVLNSSSVYIEFKDIDFPTDSVGYLTSYIYNPNLNIVKSYIDKTTDCGATWIRQTGIVNYTKFQVVDLEFINSIKGWAIGRVTDPYSSGFVWKTTDGTNWNHQLLPGNLNKIQFLTDNLGYIFGDSGIFRTTDSGENWSKISPRISGYRSGLFSDSLTGYIVTGGGPGNVYKTTNGGYNWVLQILTENPLLNPPLTNVFFVSDNIGFVIGEEQSNQGTIFKTTTGGVFPPPPQPTLLLPINNSTGISLTPLLDWNDITYVLNYRIQVSTDALFNSILWDTNGVVPSQVFIPTNKLTGLTQYFWRINATNVTGTGPWSSIWSFTTILQTPSLISPTNGSSSVSITPLLDWNDISGASSYNIQVSNNSSFTSPIINLSSLPTSQYQINSGILQANTLYYWRVSATGINGTSDWTSAWNFTTIAAPNTPNLISPTNGSNILTLTPILDWSDVSSSISYTLQAATDTTFINLVINQTGLTTSQYTVQSGSLTGNTTYYWRARAENGAGSGPWSVRWNFRVITLPPAPILVAPLNNSTNQPPTVLLDWDSLTSANTYRVQLATDSLFNTIVYDTSGVAKSSLLMRAGILLPNVKYYWRVNATNIAGTGVWSVIWNFRVNPTGLYQYSTNIPEVFKIHINYPNPFNPSTKIRFDVQRYSMVRIVVYDLTGKEIQTLVNEKIQPGRYEISFYGSQLPSGVYFYKMITEDYIETKKMLLIK